MYIYVCIYIIYIYIYIYICICIYVYIYNIYIYIYIYVYAYMYGPILWPYVCISCRKIEYLAPKKERNVSYIGMYECIY